MTTAAHKISTSIFRRASRSMHFFRKIHWLPTFATACMLDSSWVPDKESLAPIGFCLWMPFLAYWIFLVARKGLLKAIDLPVWLMLAISTLCFYKVPVQGGLYLFRASFEQFVQNHKSELQTERTFDRGQLAKPPIKLGCYSILGYAVGFHGGLYLFTSYEYKSDFSSILNGGYPTTGQSSGFAYKPSTADCPTQDRPCELTHLFGDWYSFRT